PALLVIALTLLLLCGHPESSLHIIFLGSVYALFESRARRRAVAYALAAGATTFLLLAFFLLPMIDAMTQTREWLHRTSLTGASLGKLSMRHALSVLPINVVPFFEGASGVETASRPPAQGWAGSGYVGART